MDTRQLCRLLSPHLGVEVAPYAARLVHSYAQKVMHEIEARR